MLANLDALLTALYVRVDDLLPKRVGPGRPPRITDAELIALAVAQMFLEIPNDRKFLALARWRLGHLFPYLPKQPGYNKRLRALAPTIARVITELAITSPSFCDGLQTAGLHSGSVRSVSRDARRSELAGYGQLRLVQESFTATSGATGSTCCAPRTECRSASSSRPRTLPSARSPRRCSPASTSTGYTVIADKGFAGEQFEQTMAGLGARFLRPDRKNEPRRNGSLGPVRQWIESTFWTCKGQLALERHGGRTVPGVCVRVATPHARPHRRTRPQPTNR